MLWTIAAILLVLWLVGLLADVAAGFIHILLVAAIVVVLFNFFTGGRRAT